MEKKANPLKQRQKNLNQLTENPELAKKARIAYWHAKKAMFVLHDSCLANNEDAKKLLDDAQLTAIELSIMLKDAKQFASFTLALETAAALRDKKTDDELEASFEQYQTNELAKEKLLEFCNQRVKSAKALGFTLLEMYQHALETVAEEEKILDQMKLLQALQPGGKQAAQQAFNDYLERQGSFDTAATQLSQLPIYKELQQALKAIKVAMHQCAQKTNDPAIATIAQTIMTGFNTMTLLQKDYRTQLKKNNKKSILGHRSQTIITLEETSNATNQ